MASKKEKELMKKFAELGKKSKTLKKVKVK